MNNHQLSHPMNPNQAMAESLGEQLSALMDGELARDQVRFLLRGVEAQADLTRRWSNYQLISASLKREYVAVAIPADFADRVLGRLDVQLPVAAPARRVGFGALRWVGGGAIAAAVAVVALTVSRPIDQSGGPSVAVVDPSPQGQLSQPYLPIQPQPMRNGMPLFDYNAVQPASFERTLPNYSLPAGAMPGSVEIENYRVPYYLLRVQHVPAQNVQPAAVPAQQ